MSVARRTASVNRQGPDGIAINNSKAAWESNEVSRIIAPASANHGERYQLISSAPSRETLDRNNIINQASSYFTKS